MYQCTSEAIAGRLRPNHALKGQGVQPQRLLEKHDFERATC